MLYILKNPAFKK